MNNGANAWHARKDKLKDFKWKGPWTNRQPTPRVGLSLSIVIAH